MCTELILAFIYFITIFLVNYFLFQLLKKNVEIIFYLLKIKNLLTQYSNTKGKNLFYYLIQIKKKVKTVQIFFYLNGLLETEDLLIIGNTYKFLLKNTKKDNISLNFSEKNDKKSFFANRLYFSLLQNQYLSQKE
jgi:hypothetical protein